MNRVGLLKAATITTGRLDSNAAVRGGEYPFFTCSESPLAIDSYSFDADAILLAGNNAQGNFHVNRYSGKFDAYQRTYVLTARPGYNLDFIRYSLELDLLRLKRHSQGSQTKFLTMPILESVTLAPWEITEQHSRVAALVAIDSKIALNRQVNDNLQAMLQTLYGYWFLQFDFPDENGRPYRSSGGRMIWNEQLKREIPEGWGVASLVSNPLVDPLKPGVAPFTEKTYLATADVVGTSIKNGSVIRYETREGRANMEPVLNSVWFAKMKGSVKHLFLNEVCASLIDKTILSTGFVGLRCEPIAFEYISSFVASEEFELLKDLHAHGATQQAVNNTDLENILICVPEAETLKRFNQVTSPILSRFNASIIENKQLQHLRDWLLPMLMNGQATVTSSDKLSFT